jgi:hypothetical protein
MMKSWLSLVILLAAALPLLAQEAPKEAPETADWRLAPYPPGVVHPDQFEYLGAFNVPPEGKGNLSWAYAVCGLTWRSDGDPDGPEDGHPGSLFGVGHAHGRCVSEFTIPRPVISKKKDWRDLPNARTLQKFAAVTTGTVAVDGKEFRLRVHALQYLPPQGPQKMPKLYFSGWRSYRPTNGWTHGMCHADLSKPEPAGMWRLKGHSAFCGVSACLRIPDDWAKKHCGRMTLGFGGGINGTHGYGTGRGPALFACAPWREYVDGKPPKAGAELRSKTLLKYGDWRGPTVRDVQVSDGWHGAAWVRRGDRSALVFVGVKDIGTGWYGYPKDDKGLKVFDRKKRKEGESRFVNEKGEPVEKVKGGRGWKADRPRGCIYVYDTADLAAVAAGEKQPGEPQYVARMDVTDRMFMTPGLTGCGYDPASHVLYTFEKRGSNVRYGGQPVVHVWRIGEPEDEKDR